MYFSGEGGDCGGDSVEVMNLEGSCLFPPPSSSSDLKTFEASDSVRRSVDFSTSSVGFRLDLFVGRLDSKLMSGNLGLL